ncbi:MAG: hypothetical protein AAGF95_25680 [Chloroflexota bacterium]
MFWLLNIMSCLTVGIAAHRKGYNGFLWCLGGSTPAAVILVLLPNIKQASCSLEEKTRQQIIGNAIGAILLAIVLLGILITIRV